MLWGGSNDNNNRTAGEEMSCDLQTTPQRDISQFRLWLEDWISDWFGLIDTIVGILTLTFYYPQLQVWWFEFCGRWPRKGERQ